MKSLKQVATAARQRVERTLFGATTEEQTAEMVARIQERFLTAIERAFDVSEAYEDAYDAAYHAAIERGLCEDDAHAEAWQAAEAADKATGKDGAA